MIELFEASAVQEFRMVGFAHSLLDSYTLTVRLVLSGNLGRNKILYPIKWVKISK